MSPLPAQNLKAAKSLQALCSRARPAQAQCSLQEPSWLHRGQMGAEQVPA